MPRRSKKKDKKKELDSSEENSARGSSPRPPRLARIDDLPKSKVEKAWPSISRRNERTDPLRFERVTGGRVQGVAATAALPHRDCKRTVCRAKIHPRMRTSARNARAAHDKLKTVRSADDFIGVRYLRFERIFFASMIINWILRFGDDYTRRERENLKIVERSENENPFDENLTSFVTYA